LLDLLELTPVQQLCGLDEVGRGPLAGPVTAGCVVLSGSEDTSLLKDSKLLKPSQRECADIMIREQALAWGLGWVWPDKIEELNIHHASLYAMKLAYIAMLDNFKRHHHISLELQLGLSDGKFFPELPIPCHAIIKGDQLVPSISAASIIAKVARDRYMEEQAALYPAYGFEQHKGYPSPAHKKILIQLGPCPIHRLAWVEKLTSSSPVVAHRKRHDPNPDLQNLLLFSS